MRAVSSLILVGAALFLAGTALIAVTPRGRAASERAELLWQTRRGGMPHRDGHELEPQVGTATGDQTLQKDPSVSLTPARGQWELARLWQVYKDGILDRQDYGDARQKIVAKMQGGAMRTRGARETARQLGPVLSAKEVKKGRLLIAAMTKLKKDHAYIQKQLQSPWRQDKKGLQDKDKLLTRQMAKLEGAMQTMKQSKAHAPPPPAESHLQKMQKSHAPPQRMAAEDFRDPAADAAAIHTMPASMKALSRRTFSRQPQLGSAAYTEAEVARALGTDV